MLLSIIRGVTSAPAAAEESWEDCANCAPEALLVTFSESRVEPPVELQRRVEEFDLPVSQFSRDHELLNYLLPRAGVLSLATVGANWRYIPASDTLHSVGERRQLIDLRDLYLARLAPGTRVCDALSLLEGQPGIKTVECNHLLEPASPPNDPNYPDQWHLNNTGQIEPGGTQQCIPDFDINAPEAWQINSLAGSPIAILDDGINIANPDVAPYIAPSPISKSFVPPPNEWWEGG